MDTYYKIPKRLEEYRKRISFTQEQMGDIMGVGQDHYQRLEKGTVIISNNGLEKIEEHGGDIYYLITGEKQKTGIVNELLYLFYITKIFFSGLLPVRTAYRKSSSILCAYRISVHPVYITAVDQI